MNAATSDREGVGAAAPAQEAFDEPRKGRMPRAERELQILESATTAFARSGYEAASIEEIARGCGIDRALVYQYFGGKRQLYEECCRTALNGVIGHVGQAFEGVDAANAGPDGREDLARRGIRAFFEFVRDHGDAWDVLFGAGWSALGLSNENAVIGIDMPAWVEEMLRQSYPGADPLVISTRAAHLLGASWAISLWWRKKQSLTLDEVTEQHKDFCQAVLAPLEQG